MKFRLGCVNILAADCQNQDFQDSTEDESTRNARMAFRGG